MSRNRLIMATRVRPLRPNGKPVLAAAAFVLLGMAAYPASAGPAANWRYCYAGSDQNRRFYTSRPFSTDGSLDVVDQQWAGWLTQQAVRFDTTGCPRGASRAEIEEAIVSAVRYNLGLGFSTVELNWRFAP